MIPNFSISLVSNPLTFSVGMKRCSNLSDSSKSAIEIPVRGGTKKWSTEPFDPRELTRVYVIVDVGSLRATNPSHVPLMPNASRN